MAWKVIGFMNGQDGTGHKRCPDIYGPLPRKVWVDTAGPRYRKSYRGQRLVSTATTGTKKEVTTAKAKEYAAWLAQRDGLPVPNDATAVCVWDDVEVKGKLEARVRSVVWCTQKVIKGGWKTETLLTIDIPHWDWTPAEPVYCDELPELMAA